MALSPPLPDWRGRRVRIVGASRGIGAATARPLLQKGARLAASARSREPLAALINPAQTPHLDKASKGIAVYLVNPGFVKTPLTDRNAFRMPALVSVEEAAREIARGIGRGRFEIHPPRRCTGALKLSRLLPYSVYFRLARGVTGS